MQEDDVPAASDDKRVGLRDAAAELGVHYMTAYRYVRLGALPALKVNGAWQVRVGDLRALSSREQPRSGSGGVRWSQYRTQLSRRLIAGDESGAWALIERACISGAQVEEIYLELLTPVLRDIGDAWAAGDLEVAEEHRASSVATRLIARLGPAFAVRGRKRATVIVGAVAGDQHSISVAILGDILRGRGFEVIDLGANTPAESFVECVRDRDDAIAVAIGVGSDESIEAATATAALLHERLPGVCVFIGGPAVRSEDEARRMGADEFGETAVDVAVRCVELSTL